MKQSLLIVFLYLFIFSTVLSQTERGGNETLLHNNILVHSADSIYRFPRQLGETIFVLDSTIGYSVDSNGWYKYQRKISLSRNEMGSLLTQSWQYYNQFMNSWLYSLYEEFTYYRSQQLSSESRLVWNKFENEWNPLPTKFVKYNEEGHITEYVTRTANTFGSDFEDGFRSIYELNNHNNPITSTYQYWSTFTNDWSNSQMNEYTYNSNNLMESQTGHDWHYESWQIDWRYLYEYEENNLIEILKQDWDIGENMWKNKKLISTTIDSIDNSELIITKFWDEDSMAWLNHTLENNTYDESENVIEELFQDWHTDLQEWVNEYNNLYVYNENGLIMTETIKKWWSGGWLVTGEEYYDYDNEGNLTELIKKSYDFISGEFNNANKDLYEYNNYHELIEYISQYWDNENNEWINFTRHQFLFDENQNQIQHLYQHWDNVIWINIDRSDYYWSEVEIDGVSENYGSNFLIYPNPVKSFLKLSNNEGFKEVDIKIINIDGRLVKELKHYNQNGIYVGNLSQGTYFIMINSPGYTSVRKFVKQ